MLFSLIFAYLGYTIAKYEGAVIGFMVGYIVDACLKAKRGRGRRGATKRAIRDEADRTFYECFFAMLAKLCRADGAILREEILAIDKIISETLKIKRKRKRKQVIQYFEIGKRSNQSFHIYALHLYEMFADNEKFLKNTIHILFQVAISDAPLNSEEERLIRTCAEIFAMTEAEYRSILSQYYVAPRRQAYSNGNSHSKSSESSYHKERDQEEKIVTPSSSIECFKILGCEKSDPIEKIKQAYRKLANEYHPDKIMGKDLPNDFVKFANNKFQEIQSAYEEAKKIKGAA